MIAMTALDGAPPTPGELRATPHRAGVLAARGLLVLVPVASAAAVVLHLHNGGTDITSWWYANVTMALAALPPAVLLLRRIPANPIGWLFATFCLCESLCAAGREYLVLGYHGADVPGWLWVGWICDSLYIVPSIPIALMLFPDLESVSRGARLAVGFSVVGFVVGEFGFLFTTEEPLTVDGHVFATPGLQLFPNGLADLASTVGEFAAIATLPLAIAILVARYRRSSGERRQQLKWVVFAGVLAAIELATEFIPANRFAVPDSAVMQCLLPAAITVAILRHRLFDIDVVIDRTLVFVALTSLVVGAYVGVIALADLVFGERTRPGPGLIATALVAVAFSPVRALVQRRVDRLVYGNRRNPYGAMTELGQRLEQVGHGESAVVIDAVRKALDLPYAAIVGSDGALLAETGQRGPGPAVEQLLTYQGRTVATMLVEARRGAQLDRAERRLLADLGRQAGAVVHAVRLSADLQSSRQRLVNVKENERRRLRRDLHDGLGPKLAAAGLKLDAARTVMDSEPGRSHELIGDVRGDIRSMIDDIRRLVYALRPPTLDELGLAGAIRECVDRFEVSTTDAPSMTVQAPESLPALPAAVEVAAYRIVNEAVTNVVRHADARHCLVRLHADCGLVISVHDDGTGLPAGWRPGVGTSSMSERAEELGGTLRIVTRPEIDGTQVSVRIPIDGAR
ncbi:sensor histidine kinase [uncultured Jatrophihabitans sp.]|uniref:sensor histidine kinase n=1 Tax=uncultured Jatrophihabitans sp. TaxID=1610747 RepID=UPI0035C956DF